MSEQDLGSQLLSDVDPILIDLRGLETARRSIGARSLTPAERAQLAQEIADIENAAAVLRTAQPALRSWNEPPSPVAPKPRPLWLLIGAVWLSTALVTAGAVVAIATLAG
jgi:hypothetical protein